MNLFDLDIERLDPEEAKAALSGCPIERLPSIPPFLTPKECATILGVSMKVISHLIASGQLPLTDIPGDSLAVPDLFEVLEEPSRETCILRSDLAALFEKLLLCNKPVLKTGND